VQSDLSIPQAHADLGLLAITSKKLSSRLTLCNECRSWLNALPHTVCTVKEALMHHDVFIPRFSGFGKPSLISHFFGKARNTYLGEW